MENSVIMFDFLGFNNIHKIMIRFFHTFLNVFEMHLHITDYSRYTFYIC